MIYSIPSTKTLRQCIDKYAELYEAWKTFAEVSKDCDLQVDIFDRKFDNTFQIVIFAWADNYIVSSIASSYKPKGFYEVETVLSLPELWAILD